MPAASVDTITQNVYEETASITLLSPPVGPALLLMFLFASYTGWGFWFEYRAAVLAHKRSGATSELLRPDELIPRDASSCCRGFCPSSFCSPG